MTDQKIEIGTIVHHPKRPAWGPAKTLAVEGGGNVTLYFRDLEEEKPNDAVKTISTSVIGLEIAEEQTDFLLDNLPIFENGKFKGLRKPRLSLDQAVQAFIDKQPAAFQNPKYIEEHREPKLKAHELWMNTLGDGQGAELLDAGDMAEARKRLLKIDASLGLLSSQERATLKRGLKHDDAEQFLRALMAVAAEPEADQSTYQRLIDAVDLVMDSGTRKPKHELVRSDPIPLHRQPRSSHRVQTHCRAEVCGTSELRPALLGDTQLVDLRSAPLPRHEPADAIGDHRGEGPHRCALVHGRDRNGMRAKSGSTFDSGIL